MSRPSVPASYEFELPTCILEVLVQTPMLSRWRQGNSLQALGFDLRLRDPEDPQTEPLIIQGDREQLDELCRVVDAYVQELLASTSSRLQNYVLTAHLSEFSSIQAPSGESADLDPSLALGQGGNSESHVQQNPKAIHDPGDIYLQPHSFLSHRLHLGSLATDVTGEVLELSTSRLFDLSCLLEEWTAQVASLPSVVGPLNRLKTVPIWLRSTAIAAVVVGVTTTALQLTQSTAPNLSFNSAPESSVTGGANPNLSPPPAPPPGALLVPSPPVPTGPATGEIAQSPLRTDLPSAPVSKATPDSQSLPKTLDLSPAQPLPAVTPPSQVVIPAAPVPAAPLPPPSAIAIQPEPLDQSQKSESDALTAKPAPAAEAYMPSAGATGSNFSDRRARMDKTLARSSDLSGMAQVSEIKDYFAQRWQPPPELTQTLEYSLVLNPDGSIQRVVPLGQAAATFLDRTPIPLANEPFVSAFKSSQNPVIRLVLEKSGKVQVFVESRS
jgi:hypothetical protein